jgi:hypothetical protein
MSPTTQAGAVVATAPIAARTRPTARPPVAPLAGRDLLRAAAPAAALSDRKLHDRLSRPDEPDAPPREAVPCRSGRLARDSWSPPTEFIDPRYAAALCRGCPLQAPCLEFALRQPQDGIWGGTTPQARAAARRARRTDRRGDTDAAQTAITENGAAA